MEVEVLSVSGVNKDAIISIRAGTSRRQAPVSALGSNSPPFKFKDGGEAGANVFKVDVLQPLGSIRLALKPGGGTFDVPIEGSTAGISLKLNVKKAGLNDDADPIERNEGDNSIMQPGGGEKILASPAPIKLPFPKDEDGFPATAAAAREYLDRHQLLQFLRSLLQTVVRDRPSDPYNFIADQFRNAEPPLYAPKEDSPGTVPPDVLAADKEVETAKANARDALSMAILGQTTEASPPPVPPRASKRMSDEDDDDEEFTKQTDEAKAVAPVRSPTAVFNDEEEKVKAKARDALFSALLSEPENELDKAPGSEEEPDPEDQAAPGPFSLKPSVGTWLSRSPPTTIEVLKEELLRPLSANEFQKAKDKIKDAFIRIVAPVDEEAEATKAKAREAIEAALFSTAAEDEPNVEDVKDKARSALAAALLEEEPNVEDVKDKARSALAAALLEDEPDVEDVKNKARDALAAAFSMDIQGEDSTKLGTARLKARDALVAVLLTDDRSVEEAVKEKARAALADALFADQGTGSASMQTAKTKARDALASLMLSDELKLDSAKGKARSALTAAMFEDEDPDAVMAAKAKAREALEVAMLPDDETHIAFAKLEIRRHLSATLAKETPDAEDVKSKARDALAAALLADETDLETAQSKARDTLEAAFLEDDTGMDSPRAKAREALANAMFGDAEVDQAKQRAREALEKALCGEGDEDVEAVKAKARDAVSNALFDDVEAMKLKAQDALDKALKLDTAASVSGEDQAITADMDETAHKATLKAKKDEMHKQNESLKGEIEKLNSSLKKLMEERDILMQHARANR